MNTSATKDHPRRPITPPSLADGSPRSVEEIEAEIKHLRDTIGERREQFEAAHARAAGLIETQFDEQVKAVFRRIRAELPAELAAFDQHLEQVVGAYLAALDATVQRVEGDGHVELAIGPCVELPHGLRKGLRVAVGEGYDAEGVDPLHLGHPLVLAAVDHARQTSARRFRVLVAGSDLPRGVRGRLRLVRVRYEGFEVLEALMPVAVLEGARDPVSAQEAWSVLNGTLSDAAAISPVEVPSEDLDDAVDEELFLAQGEVSSRQQRHFQRMVQQIETSMEDRLLILARQQAELMDRLMGAEDRRDKAMGPEVRAKAQRMLERYTSQLEGVETEIEGVRQREDSQYERWMGKAHERRSRPPKVDVLLEMEFEVA